MAVEQASNGRTGEPRRGWAGTVIDSSSSAPRHQWEGGAAPGIDRHFRASRRRWRLRITAFFLLILALTAAYLVLLLHFPQRTPLVVAAAYQYDWPVSPNAWTREDIATLRRLDGQLVEMLDASLAWKSRQHILSDWERTLARIARRRSDTQSAVFYLSLHGVVAEDGAPCLLPPKASPFDRDQWVSVRELLERVRDDLPPDLNVLVVFDCNRQLDNWNAGLVHNTFALRLGELVADLNLPNLAVLNSTSEGEAAWASAELRASVFGRAVMLGMAGAADRTRPTPSTTSAAEMGIESIREEAGGDGDGIVSVRELERYVAREVKRWSRAQRHAMQTPKLWPESARDFTVTWTLHPRTLAKIEQELASAPAAADSVTAEEIAALWSSLDALRDLRLERYDPVQWHDLEHQLMWLERLASSGEGYGVAATATHRALRERLEKAVQAAAAVKARPTLAGHLSVLNADRVTWPRTLPLAGFPLSDNCGLFTAAQVDAIDSAVRASAIGEGEPLPEGNDPPRERVERLAEVHWRKLANAYRLRELWTDAAMSREMADQRSRFERLLARVDFRALPLLRSWLDEADRRRRLAEDQFLAGEVAAATDPAASLREVYDELADQPNAPAAALDRAWAVRDRALAELPYWARWTAGQWRRLASASSTRGTTSSEAARNESPSTAADPSRLVELVAAAISLADTLETPASNPAEALRNIVTMTDQLEQRLDSLAADFRARCSEMEKDPYASGDGMRNLEDALELPFLPSEQRLNLRRSLTRTARELHSQTLSGNREVPANAASRESSIALTIAASEGDSSSGADAAGTGSTSRGSSPATPADSAGVLESQRLANWRVHPLMAILWSDEERLAMESSGGAETLEGKSELASHLEKTSHRLRLRLLEIAASVRGTRAGMLPAPAADTAAGTRAEEAVDSEDLIRASPSKQLQLMERRTRLAAAVWFPDTGDDAIQARRRHDFQRTLLWYAERTLDDSWGAGPRDPLIASAAKPFFEQAVADYVRACEMIGPADNALADAMDQLRKRLALRSQAFLHWAAIRSRRDETMSAEKTVGYLTTITVPRRESPAAAPNRGSTDTAGETWGVFPQGLATVALRTSERRPVGTRATTSVPLPSEEIQVSLVAPAAESGLESVLVFRGNEIPEAVDDRLSTGVVVDVRPTYPTEAQVTLYGDRRQRSSVLFILDCSGSMAREIAVEATGPSTLPRLELAKSALQSLLDQLAPRGEARVGVRFFGHRVGFSTEKPVKVLRQEAYPAPIPDDLHPGEDIELFLPLGRFDSVEAGRVGRRLEALLPWGQSPLYRALLQARADFDTEPEDTYKSVVVITDGENYQFAGNDPTLRAPQSTTVNDVRTAFEGRKLPIYILGFGLSQTEDQATEKEFAQLAQATGGEYFSVQNGRDLLKVLRTRLGVGTYSLRDSQSVTVSESGEAPKPIPSSANEARQGESRLNLPLTIHGLGEGVKPYQVRFESATTSLALEGGEAVTLQTSPDGRDIFALPYEQGLPLSDSLSSSGHRQRFTVRAHRPLLAGRVARFRVSLQDEDLRFTPRPAEVWIEIKPIVPDAVEEPRTYVFYDRVFVANEPVPVIDCVANNWPEAAKTAEIRAWCKLTPTPSAYSLAASELIKDLARFEQPRTVSGVDGFQFRVTAQEATLMPAAKGAGSNDATATSSERASADATMGWELRVITQVEEQGPDVASLRVTWLGDASARPVRIVHRYEPNRRQATHAFWFPVSTTREMLAKSGASLVFTTRQATRNGSFRSPNDRPLLVEVSGTDGTLQLDAATGPR